MFGMGTLGALRLSPLPSEAMALRLSSAEISMASCDEGELLASCFVSDTAPWLGVYSPRSCKPPPSAVVLTGALSSPILSSSMSSSSGSKPPSGAPRLHRDRILLRTFSMISAWWLATSEASVDSSRMAASSLIWMLAILRPIDTIRRCGHRLSPCRRQIRLMALGQMPRASAASLMPTWKYCASSSYHKGRVHTLNSGARRSGTYTCKYFTGDSVSMCECSPSECTSAPECMCPLEEEEKRLR
mmetsp:Transcript_41105/g.60455  ORF Transcript_41105/g.60455 Transcript_41105/m.60455 type:complete len:244 (+) Transcript_41105:333-1064(+)